MAGMTGVLGVDVGGTFTDLAWWSDGRLEVGKTSSTVDQSDGVVAGARSLLSGASTSLLVHGTTVATNALLERAGARVALVTSPGFEDVIEIGRQDRPSLYDSFADRAAPLVERGDRHGWEGGADLDLDGVEAVAVSLLDGYRRPEEESAIRAVLAEKGIPVVTSHQVSPEFREFERTSTTVVTAYLEPRVARYLVNLDRQVVPAIAERLMVMRSSGGLMSPEDAARSAASILLSGPAGGVVAAAALGASIGRSRVISFDMGGTSTDVCRIEDGRPEVMYERSIDGFVIRTPSVAVHTVGAGGGSIAWIDPGGALRVGPRSAGAHPGPASYGRGGREATVSDAHVVLGRLGGALADGVVLEVDAARTALFRLGEQAGISEIEAAAGVVEVVEATMERAVRAVSVEQGADPSSAVLLAFGGAGGLHGGALARRLEMSAMVVPPHAGVFSALGLLLAPPRTDAAQTVITTDIGVVDRTCRQVAELARGSLVNATGSEPSVVETLVDVRYIGQAHETTVSYRPGDGWTVLVEAFEREHARRNGFSRPGDPVEAVTVRAAAVGSPAMAWSDLPEHQPAGDERVGARTVFTGDAWEEVVVWNRAGLAPGGETAGPCIVADEESTTWIGPDERGVILDSGALEVTW